MTIELVPPFRHKWQLKAFKQMKQRKQRLCHCWDCLRARGITPDRDSHESHRRNVLPSSPLYSTADGSTRLTGNEFVLSDG